MGHVVNHDHVVTWKKVSELATHLVGYNVMHLADSPHCICSFFWHRIAKLHGFVLSNWSLITGWITSISVEGKCNRIEHRKNVWDPFYWHGFTLLSAWISNYIHYKMWDEITHPFPNFNSANVEVWEWISSFIPHFAGNVITSPSWN